MATVEVIQDGHPSHILSLTRQEAADLIGLLAAQLAGGVFRGHSKNVLHTIKVTDARQVESIWSVTLSLLPLSASREVIEPSCRSIYLTRRDASDIIALLAPLLAGAFGGGSVPSIFVQDKGRPLYRLAICLQPNASEKIR